MLENPLESPTVKECGTEIVPTPTRLPPEILYALIEHLRMDDILILRDVSQLFSSLSLNPRTDNSSPRRKSTMQIEENSTPAEDASDCFSPGSSTGRGSNHLMTDWD